MGTNSIKIYQKSAGVVVHQKNMIAMVKKSEPMAMGDEAYSMYEELSRCKGFLTRFGGHRQAAGLSMRRENLEPFRQEINENCSLSAEDLSEKVVIDMEMPFSCVTEALVEELELLEPFGKGNTKPVFAARGVRPLNLQILGRNRKVLKMQVEDLGGTRMEALYFGDPEEFRKVLEQKEDGRLSVTFYPGINEYMGRRSLQIVITHCQ